MQVITAPFGANAPRVSAVDRDTLVSTTGATWFSPDGQPIARPTSRVGQMLAMAIRGKRSQPEQVCLPVGKPLPMNWVTDRDAFVADRYWRKAEALTKLTVGWPVAAPKIVDLDARCGVPGDFSSADFEANFKRSCRALGIQVSASVPGPVLYVPHVKSRNERRLSRLARRELERRNAVTNGRPLPTIEIDHSQLDIIVLDHTQKERVR
ncbi:MAG: hypothetical protein OJJ21_22105 [Ferrovibrio sp.]|uniref:hypothetical protein n=1 Tax=Ferrovibrio sp. TaxID=1917215 RepID=UPI00260B26D1|nr:hypothetical protein [Ferrovibrio sp.]MCW0236307.1 hypothetical protein [Ferrovibrio sp.]